MQYICNPGSGFVNLGNSCFLNSTLQALFYIPGFSDILESHNLSCGPATQNCATCSVADTLKSTKLTPIASFKPDLVFSKLKLICSHFIPGFQNDAHEFLLGLLHIIVKEFPLATHFKGILESAIFCNSCHNYSTSICIFTSNCQFNFGY